MGVFDHQPAAERWGRQPAASEPQSEDERAIARYRYLLNTAPPEAIEQAHAEAFAQLTPEQRRLLLQRLAEAAPAAERARVEEGGMDAQALARIATRTELRQPGALERLFGGSAAPGFGTMMAGSLLGSIAGTVLGSMVAREFMTHAPHGLDAPGFDSHQPAADADAWSADAGTLDEGGSGTGGDFDAGTFDV